MSDETQQIIDLETWRCELVASCDSKTLGGLLAEDYVHVRGDGGCFDKGQYLEWVQITPRQQARDNLIVRFHGDVAILNGDIVNRLRYNDEVRTIYAYVTQILVKQDSQWRFVHWHITEKAAEGS